MQVDFTFFSTNYIDKIITNINYWNHDIKPEFTHIKLLYKYAIYIKFIEILRTLFQVYRW